MGNHADLNGNAYWVLFTINSEYIDIHNSDFIALHTLVTGYYVLMLAVRMSVRPKYVRPSVRTSFPFDNLSIYKRISFKFCICIRTNNVSLGVVNGQI